VLLLNRLLFLKRLDTVLGRPLSVFLPSPSEKPIGQCEKILVIRPGGIGDAVLLVPMVDSLRKSFPNAIIDVLAEQRNAAVIELTECVDKTFKYDLAKDLLSVLCERYDVIIDTEQWHRLSAVVTRIIRSTVKIGFATNSRKRLFNYPIAYSHQRYERESFIDLLKPFGQKMVINHNKKFLNVPVSAKVTADKKLGPFVDEQFIALFPGASIPERRWGEKKFHNLARLLIDCGIRVVVVGSIEDRTLGEKIVHGLGGLNLAGQTSLVETAAIIENAKVLVSGDSGILHIGVGLGKPTVSLFGSGIAAKWAPKGESHVVLNKSLPCSPCTRFGYTPPCPNEMKCVNDIDSKEVYEAVMLLLKISNS
jgi:lipopolysaccharide heptosyltransferase II